MRGTENISAFVGYITDFVVGTFTYLSSGLVGDVGKFIMKITSWVPGWAWNVMFCVLVVTGIYMIVVAIKKREDLYKIYP